MREKQEETIRSIDKTQDIEDQEQSFRSLSMNGLRLRREHAQRETDILANDYHERSTALAAEQRAREAREWPRRLAALNAEPPRVIRSPSPRNPYDDDFENSSEGSGGDERFDHEHLGGTRQWQPGEPRVDLIPLRDDGTPYSEPDVNQTEDVTSQAGSAHSDTYGGDPSEVGTNQIEEVFDLDAEEVGGWSGPRTATDDPNVGAAPPDVDSEGERSSLDPSRGQQGGDEVMSQESSPPKQAKRGQEKPTNREARLFAKRAKAVMRKDRRGDKRSSVDGSKGVHITNPKESLNTSSSNLTLVERRDAPSTTSLRRKTSGEGKGDIPQTPYQDSPKPEASEDEVIELVDQEDNRYSHAGASSGVVLRKAADSKTAATTHLQSAAWSGTRKTQLRILPRQEATRQRLTPSEACYDYETSKKGERIQCNAEKANRAARCTKDPTERVNLDEEALATMVEELVRESGSEPEESANQRIDAYEETIDITAKVTKLIRGFTSTSCAKDVQVLKEVITRARAVIPICTAGGASRSSRIPRKYKITTSKDEAPVPGPDDEISKESVDLKYAALIKDQIKTSPVNESEARVLYRIEALRKDYAYSGTYPVTALTPEQTTKYGDKMLACGCYIHEKRGTLQQSLERASGDAMESPDL